jgi:class III poly(R)-hydroxyalkanoic acid synthase PhaE subunit
MMGMGMNREANEDQMKAVGSYIKMVFSVGTLVSLVADASKNSTKALMERYQKELKEGKTITTFREFYNLWYKVTEDILLELLNTDSFSKAFGDFSDKYSKFLIASNKVMERMLEPLPIPTNKDMTSLYKTVYDLRKEVRDLKRELESAKATK